MSAAESTSDLLEQIRARRAIEVDQALRLIAASSAADDSANRLSLLRIAARALEDPAVSQAWIDTIAAEVDTGVRRIKVAAIADLLAGTRARKAHFDQATALIGTLVRDLADQALRPSSLAVLSLLALRTPQVAEALAEAYRGMRSAAERAAIVAALAPLRYRWDGMTEFLLKALPDLDASLKPDIASYLYRRRALAPTTLVALLGPAEASTTRLAILTACNDESLPLDPAVVTAIYAALATDADPSCRAEAAQFVEHHTGDGNDTTRRVEALVEVIARDGESALRLGAAEALGRIGGLDDGVLTRLVALLESSTDLDVARSLVDVLSPFATANDRRGAEVRSAFLVILERAINTSLAVRIIEVIARSWRAAPELATEVLALFEQAGNDVVAGALLDVLADEGWAAAPIGVFAAACRSASSRVREAGMRGLATVSLTPENEPILLAALPLVNEAGIDGEVRRRFARKVARIPAPAADALSTLRVVIQGLPAGDANRADLEKLLDRAGTRCEDVEPEWELWRSRLYETRRTDGMLPALYLLYDAYPVKAAALLKEIVKTEGHDGGRHGAEFHSDWAILSFLVTRGVIDDEMSRFALDRLLGRDGYLGNLSSYLSLVKSNLRFPGLQQMLWEVLERPTAFASVDTMLLFECMILAYGSDGALLDAYLQRSGGTTSAEGLRPYVALLAACPRWEGAVTALAALQARHGSMLHEIDDVDRLVSGVYAAHGLAAPDLTEGTAGDEPTAGAKPVPGVLLDE